LVPLNDWQSEIHERLVAGEVTAPAELVEVLLEPLLDRLTKRFPKLPDPDLLPDAVTDALMSYIKRPEQFDPGKRSLIGFLVMAAEGDLLNALAKVKRRREKEIPLADVELELVGGNYRVEEDNSEAGTERDKVQQALPLLIKDPKDLKAIGLMLTGERATAAFAKVWKLQHLTPDQQRREVKRHKDRLKKRLERYGKAAQRKP
jgi:RNA polymerase sigma-70 factor, ECF subfamily